MCVCVVLFFCEYPPPQRSSIINIVYSHTRKPAAVIVAIWVRMQWISYLESLDRWLDPSVLLA